MAKNKPKDNDKNKRKNAKKQDDGSAAIKRAEERLAAALADVDDARTKVARRERDLAALMERHGHTAALDASITEAIPLGASSQAASANGTAQDDVEPANPAPAEQPAATGVEHHG